MVAVAFGHWMAIAVFKDTDDSLVAKNALEFDYSLAWVTWALQVMPLFFLAGGFSSAVSLDSHNRKDGRPRRSVRRLPRQARGWRKPRPGPDSAPAGWTRRRSDRQGLAPPSPAQDQD